MPYKGLSERTTHILAGVEEIFATLEDNLTVLNIIKSSRYVGPIRVSVCVWNIQKTSETSAFVGH